MRFRLDRVRRRLPWPAWAVAAVVGFTALTGLLVLLAERTPGGMELCLFKRITGYPCPTCGTGRAGMCLLRGEFLTAWTLNPLIGTLLAGLGVAMAVRLLFGRAVRVEANRREGYALLALAIAAVLANWVYVIVYVG